MQSGNETPESANKNPLPGTRHLAGVFIVSLLKINLIAVWMKCERAHAGLPLCGSTLIAMVQTADLGEGNDIAGRGRLYETRPWTVLVERKMRSGVMMVLKIAR
jgi:hypothetical protein